MRGKRDYRAHVADLEDLVVVGVVAPDDDPDAARGWLGVVHDAARAEHARVLGEMHEIKLGRSFYAQALTVDQGTITLLLNPGAGLVACVADEHPFPANAAYVPVPGSTLFEIAGFRVATPEEMQSPVTERVFDRVGGIEADDLRYHRPTRLGDVFFNRFD
jgi:hypothetical protein